MSGFKSVHKELRNGYKCNTGRGFANDELRVTYNGAGKQIRIAFSAKLLEGFGDYADVEYKGTVIRIVPSGLGMGYKINRDKKAAAVVFKYFNGFPVRPIDCSQGALIFHAERTGGGIYFDLTQNTVTSTNDAINKLTRSIA